VEFAEAILEMLGVKADDTRREHLVAVQCREYWISPGDRVDEQ
jgi:hypothetical protein